MEVTISKLPKDFEYSVRGQTQVQNTEFAKQGIGSSEQSNEKEDVDIQGLVEAAEETTQWIQGLNTDIQFQIHKGTGQLIVQVVDTKEGKVLKEFPPREFLDTVAKIREYVGILLDKKI